MLVFGEDVGRLGGVFRVTDGLQTEFGAERVFDTPIAEAGDRGRGGRAWRSRDGRAWSRCSSTRSATRRSSRSSSHVAKYRERTRGRVDMPITIRIPSFGGIRGKEHHGESPETYYVHTAGLKVVAPVRRARRVPAAAPRDRRSRPGDRARAEGAVLVEGGRRAHRRRARDRRGPGRARRRRLHGRSRTARWWRGASRPRTRWRARASRRASWTCGRSRRWTST